MPKHEARDEPICKWDRKELQKHLGFLVSEVVASPRYVCIKCGRAASEKIYLCKGRKMSHYR